MSCSIQLGQYYISNEWQVQTGDSSSVTGVRSNGVTKVNTRPPTASRSSRYLKAITGSILTRRFRHLGHG